VCRGFFGVSTAFSSAAITGASPMQMIRTPQPCPSLKSFQEMKGLVICRGREWKTLLVSSFCLPSFVAIYLASLLARNYVLCLWLPRIGGTFAEMTLFGYNTGLVPTIKQSELNSLCRNNCARRSLEWKTSILNTRLGRICTYNAIYCCAS